MKNILISFVLLICHLSVFGQINVDSLPSNTIPLEEVTPGAVSKKDFMPDYMISVSLETNFNTLNFTDFRPLLKDYNVELMNRPNGTVSVLLAGSRKRLTAGLSIGGNGIEDSDNDSLSIAFNTTQYGLHFGYHLIFTRRILFTPTVSLNWSRYKLTNSPKDYRIPLERYLNDRDLDVRFNQLTGFVGGKLSFLFHVPYPFISNGHDRWAFGVYGGYVGKLNDVPWVYSRENRLITSGKIGMEQYTFGLFFSSHSLY